MSVPDWWQFLLLFGGAFRTFRLIAEDTILDGPRARLLGYKGWVDGQPLPKTYRAKWGEFITCPWCAGFHIGVIFWICWLIWPTATLFVCVPLAVNAAVGMVAKLDN